MKKTTAFVLLVLSVSIFSALAATIQQPAPKEQDKTVQAQPQPDKIVAAPQNIKERTAIFVFVGWLWAAIFVLIYILRLEIKEADRLLDLKFYRDEKK
jgi:hypothetical protein